MVEKRIEKLQKELNTLYSELGQRRTEEEETERLLKWRTAAGVDAGDIYEELRSLAERIERAQDAQLEAVTTDPKLHTASIFLCVAGQPFLIELINVEDVSRLGEISKKITSFTIGEGIGIWMPDANDRSITAMLAVYGDVLRITAL